MKFHSFFKFWLILRILSNYFLSTEYFSILSFKINKQRCLLLILHILKYDFLSILILIRPDLDKLSHLGVAYDTKKIFELWISTAGIKKKGFVTHFELQAAVGAVVLPSEITKKGHYYYVNQRSQQHEPFNHFVLHLVVDWRWNLSIGSSKSPKKSLQLATFWFPIVQELLHLAIYCAVFHVVAQSDDSVFSWAS